MVDLDSWSLCVPEMMIGGWSEAGKGLGSRLGQCKGSDWVKSGQRLLNLGIYYTKHYDL